MFTRLRLFCSVIAFFLSTENVKAGINVIYTDSTCCAPDSLKVMAVGNSIFCVSWQAHLDSACKMPQGFEIEWKRLIDSIWNHKSVPDTSGSTIFFCDTASRCGLYQWRVRTKCNDSTYSDWVYGHKFNALCPDGRINTPDFSGSAKLAGININLHGERIKAKQVSLFIVNRAARRTIAFNKRIKPKYGNQLLGNRFFNEWHDHDAFS